MQNVTRNENLLQRIGTLMVAVSAGVLFVVLSILLYQFLFGTRSVSKLAQVEADFRVMGTALDSYRQITTTYPTTEQGLEALVSRPFTNPVQREWNQVSKKIPLDPWRNPYRYRFPGKNDAALPEIISAGPDRVKYTPDDLSSQDE